MSTVLQTVICSSCGCAVAYFCICYKEIQVEFIYNGEKHQTSGLSKPVIVCEECFHNPEENRKQAHGFMTIDNAAGDYFIMYDEPGRVGEIEICKAIQNRPIK